MPANAINKRVKKSREASFFNFLRQENFQAWPNSKTSATLTESGPNYSINEHSALS